MKIHRFYTEENLAVGKEARLQNSEQAHQIRKVFRMGEGDRVVLFNGSGKEYVSKIIGIEKEGIAFLPEEEKAAFVPKIKLHVYLASIRKERFEWAVEKLTEIGVSSVTPIVTDRSEHTYLNLERLKKIAIEASEQSGRGNVPEINEPQKLQELDLVGETLVCDFGDVSLKSLNLEAKSLQLLIGPEGGWSDVERAYFKSKEFQIISLGEATLRAETAALIASATVFHQM